MPPAPPGVPPIRPAARVRAHTGTVVGVVGAAALLMVGAVAVVVATLDGPGPRSVRPSAAEVDRTGVLARAVGAELDRWWAVQLRVREDAAPYVAVGERLTDGDDGVVCDGEQVVLDDELYDNAWAALCREGPTVAYDPATFRGSDVALQVILAHEWGHVAQALEPSLDEIVVDPDAPYAETELQADCYAGAWAAVGLDDREVQLAVLELRALGDPPDVPPDDPDGHGTGDEREVAFRLGLDHGISACLPEVFDARP